MSQNFSKKWDDLYQCYQNHTTCPIYSLTKRPIVNYDDYDHLIDIKKRNSFEEGHHYLPVVRYETYSYAKAGSYFDPQPVKYCGKFFFFEPQSTILLDLGKTMFFPSKQTCAMWLHQHYDNPSYFNQDQELKELQELGPIESVQTRLTTIIRPQFSSIMSDFYSDLNPPPPNLPRRIRLTQRFGPYVHPWWVVPLSLKAKSSRVLSEPTPEIIEYYRQSIEPFYQDFPKSVNEINVYDMYGFEKPTTEFLPDNKAKLTSLTAFYPSIPLLTDNSAISYKAGVNDRTDQYLCLLGTKAGFDTFVFQHEVGEGRSVTEIVDMREQPHKYLREIPPTRLTNNTFYKRFWSPEKPLLTAKDTAFKTLQYPQWSDPMLATIWFPSDGVITSRGGQLLVDENPDKLLWKPAQKESKKTPAPVSTKSTKSTESTKSTKSTKSTCVAIKKDGQQCQYPTICPPSHPLYCRVHAKQQHIDC
jgi:hypothetical protein